MTAHTALPWREMAEAPKDGTWIMGWAESDKSPYRISWGRNHNHKLAWCTSFASFVDGYITHWQPLYPPGTEHPQPVTSELLEAAKVAQEYLLTLKELAKNPKYVPSNNVLGWGNEILDKLNAAILSTEGK